MSDPFKGTNIKNKKETIMGEIVNIKKENQLSYLNLSKSEKNSIQKIMKEIDLNNTQSIIQYGVGAQKNVSEFADNILDQIRSKDSGRVGESLTDLMLKVKNVDVTNLTDKKFMQKIPFIGGLFDKSKNFIASFDKLSVQIDSIKGNLDRSQREIMKDINVLDMLYEKNYEYLKQIQIFILAGEMKLKEMEEKELPLLEAEAVKTSDPQTIQKVNDAKHAIASLERKIHDLKLTRIIAINTAPQIRMVQRNDQALAEKIQSSILHTLPLWKEQVVMSIAIMRQNKALKIQQEVSKTTNDLLKKNADMLKENSAGIAREVERGIVDIDTLKEVHAKFISTITETIAIQEEGRKQRHLAEAEIVQMEKDFKHKLLLTAKNA